MKFSIGGADVLGDMEAAREVMVAKMHEANVPVSPDADIGVDDIMLMTQMGTISHEVCMETIRQWGEKIIPAFR